MSRTLGTVLSILLLSGAAATGVGVGLATAPPTHAEERGVTGQEVVRGPYLQRLTSTSAVLRWRTALPAVGRAVWGPLPGPPIYSAIGSGGPTTEHAVVLDDLLPGTRYGYAVGTDLSLLVGDDGIHAFRTPPTAGTAEPIRVFVQGDSGTANSNAALVYDAYLDFEAQGRPTDVWLMLGDNAYELGTDAEYQAALFDMFPELLIRAPLWPTLGNHDTFSFSQGLPGPYPYYDIFTLPAQAEAGGVPSGTEAYYSFDHANVHFVVLDSMISDRSVGGAMWTWLQADLAATQQDWIVAYWHHPPYSKGSHDSDTETRLIQMRENFLPLLEGAGVDLVLAGHSHSYERTCLIDGHYGDSSTWNLGFALDPGDGRVDGSGPYQKPIEGPLPNSGAVYTVAGSSGKTTGGPLDHPATIIGQNVLGSLVLDFQGNRLDVTFLGHLGQIHDTWTMTKGLEAPDADFVADRTAGPAPLAVQFADASTNFPDAWEWDFEDDGVDDSAAESPAHVYDAPGRYSVRLRATNLGGTGQRLRESWVCVQTADPTAAAGLVWDDPASLRWSAGATDAGWDVLRGDLATLRATGDPGAAQESCLPADPATASAVDPEVPPPGSGRFYLVRPADCGGRTGSWGVDGDGVARDAALQGAGAVCGCAAGDDADGDGSCDGGWDACLDPDGDGFGEGPGCAGPDVCPAAFDPAQADADGDGLGDSCDACPLDAENDLDGDGACGDVDNCPWSNPAQTDTDGDGLGDACDVCPTSPENDADGDGICGDVDNCPAASNPEQTDADGDGAGDACDPCPDDSFDDFDGDGVCGDVDNCSVVPNPAQLDPDGDGSGSACDPCPLDADDDLDGDGLCGDVDNCPAVINTDQLDTDGDGPGDACDPCTDSDGDGAGDPGKINPTCPVDNCPSVFNPAQTDADADGLGDACDVCPADPTNDVDGDGICGLDDNCPAVINPGQQDGDGDDKGDACDPCPGDTGNDPDGDGVCFASDNCPGIPNPEQIDADGDGVGDGCDTCTDTDADGYGDPSYLQNLCLDDNCPATINPGQEDPDGDGLGTACDVCPADADNDIDGDGVCGDIDGCPDDFNPTQVDTDDDGTDDACDICPFDPRDDRDADGVCGDVDNCPNRPNPGQEDSDGDGLGDACDPT